MGDAAAVAAALGSPECSAVVAGCSQSPSLGRRESRESREAIPHSLERGDTQPSILTRSCLGSSRLFRSSSRSLLRSSTRAIAPESARSAPPESRIWLSAPDGSERSGRRHILRSMRRSMASAAGGWKGTPTLDREPQKPPSMMFETLRKRSKPWWVIDPRKSRWMSIWDMAGTLALLYTALVTPFEVSFLEAPDTWTMARSDVLFLINRLVDAIFIIDMFVNFVLMYQEADAIRGVRWIDEPRNIAAHYAKTW